MKKSDIARIRLFNQQITSTDFAAPEEIVSWLGAMQAQDYPMAKWAIGARLPDSTEAQVEQAIQDGKIFRTHLLRPTWHFVSAEDIRWMIALSAPQLISTTKSQFKQLELDANLCRQSLDLIAKILENGNHLTRNEIVVELQNSGIKTENLQATCLMFYAEISGIVCNGIKRGKQQTYALLDERVPPSMEIARDEAIARLTEKYFTSHAPATLKDFIWWSGLPTADARKGLEMNKSLLESREIEGEIYWMPKNISFPEETSESFYLLPAFDEFMVSYKDRSASIAPHLAKQAMTVNGIFKPIIVINGQIRGIWKRTFKTDKVFVEKELFDGLSETENKSFIAEAKKYAEFEGKTLS